MKNRAIAMVAAIGFSAFVACNGSFRFDEPPSDAGSASDASATDVAFEASYEHCAIDADCILATLHCDVLSGTCVECVADSNCTTAFPRCDSALHRCVQCGVDGDCAAIANSTCEPTTHQCLVQCGNSGGSACPAATPVCSSALGASVECSDNADCVGNSAGTDCDHVDGRCGECDRDEECPSARPHCDRLHDVCVECTTSADCPTQKPLCDPSGYACTPA